MAPSPGLLARVEAGPRKGKGYCRPPPPTSARNVLWTVRPQGPGLAPGPHPGQSRPNSSPPAPAPAPPAAPAARERPPRAPSSFPFPGSARRWVARTGQPRRKRWCPAGSPGPPAPGPQTRGARRPRGSAGTGNFPAARPAARSVLRLMTGSRGPGGGAGGGFRAGEAGPAGPVLRSQAAAGPVSSTRNFCFPLCGAGRKNNN